MNLLLAEGSNDKSLEFPTTRGFHPEVGAGFQPKHFPLLEDSQVAHDALLVFGVVVLVRTIDGERGTFPHDEASAAGSVFAGFQTDRFDQDVLLEAKGDALPGIHPVGS